MHKTDDLFDDIDVPEADDIAAEMVPYVVDGDAGPLARKLGVTAEKLEALLASDETFGDLINVIANEYEETLRMKLLLASGTAVDTLIGAMNQRFDGKKAMAAVKAASEILDRSRFPKQTRIHQGDRQASGQKTLPALDELLEKADNEQDAQDIFKRHRSLIAEIEALRKGAKEIIDVSPVQSEIQKKP